MDSRGYVKGGGVFVVTEGILRKLGIWIVISGNVNSLEYILYTQSYDFRGYNDFRPYCSLNEIGSKVLEFGVVMSVWLLSGYDNCGGSIKLEANRNQIGNTFHCNIYIRF